MNIFIKGEISIIDNNPGIKDKIFYPFFTTKAVGEGAGLSLAMNIEILNGIVRNHGGEIIAESGKEHGSAFRIRLPLGEGNG